MHGKKTAMSLAIKSKPDRSQYVDLLHISVCYSLNGYIPIISYARRKSSVLSYSRANADMSFAPAARKQLQIGGDLLKALRSERIDERLRAPLDMHQSAFPQHGEVMGDGRRRQFELIGKFPRRVRAGKKQQQDLPPRAVRERAPDVLFFPLWHIPPPYFDCFLNIVAQAARSVKRRVLPRTKNGRCARFLSPVSVPTAIVVIIVVVIIVVIIVTIVIVVITVIAAAMFDVRFIQLLDCLDELIK